MRLSDGELKCFILIGEYAIFKRKEIATRMNKSIPMVGIYIRGLKIELRVSTYEGIREQYQHWIERGMK